MTFTYSSIISWSNVSCSGSTSYWPLFANRTNYRSLIMIMAFHFQIVHSQMNVKDFLGKKMGSEFSSAATFPDTFCSLVSFRSKEDLNLVLNRVSHKHTKLAILASEALLSENKKSSGDWTWNLCNSGLMLSFLS